MTLTEMTTDVADADLLGWLAQQLRPITVVGAGMPASVLTWSEMAPYSRSIRCDPFETTTTGAAGQTVRAAALAVYRGEDQLNVTRNRARSSLLEPNWPVVSRHGDRAGFEVVERVTAPTVTLSDMAAEHGPLDVLRLDCRGLEYQLLSSALPTVSNAICIEIHGGLVDNYVGQYPLPTVSTLLHGAGYTLVDLATSARPDEADPPGGRCQPLEYRGVWLRDYVLRPEGFSFDQAVKLLLLCRQLGFLSFGRELSVVMHGQSMLSDRLAGLLRRDSVWRAQWHVPTAFGDQGAPTPDLPMPS
jgi:FkbM family methyltransferase